MVYVVVADNSAAASYSVGHLKRGSAWKYRNGQSHYNEKDTKPSKAEGIFFSG